MGTQTKTIGRMPTDHGPYDPNLAYGKKFVVTLFGCGWESKHDNNTTAPATLNSQTGTITPNTAYWKKRWGSYEQWLIDNGYKKVDAANVKDGNYTQHEINNAVANEIGTDSTPSSIKGRVTNLESAVGSGGSVDSRIASAVNTEKNRAEGVESGHNTRIEALETAVGSGGSVDERIATEGARHYLKAETYTKTEVNGLVDTPHQEYVTVDAYSALPATGSKDTIYRVSNYNGSTSQVDESVYSEYAWDGSQYVFLCVKSQIGEVFDISAYNNNAKYADLEAALNGGANIPQSLQKGGMSIKFVQSSDNKYVQFRCTANEFTTDTTKWQDNDIERIDHTINSIIGVDAVNDTITMTAGSTFNELFNYHFYPGDKITISVSDNCPMFLYIALYYGEDVVYRPGNVSRDSFPYTFTTENEATSIKIACFSAGSVIYSGDLDVVVHVVGEIDILKQSVGTLNEKCDDLTTEISFVESSEKEIVGRYIPKLEVQNDNVYINSYGVLVDDEDYYVSKPIALHAGDTVLMKYPAGIGSFASIFTYNSDTDANTPVYINDSSNNTQRYTAKSDFDAYFSIYKNGTEIIIDNNSGLSGEIHSLDNGIVLTHKLTISSGVQRHIFDCLLKQGDLVYVKLKDNKLNTISISLIDSNDDIVYSSGNLNMWKIPYKICVPVDCAKMRVAVWDDSWVEQTGDMTVIVKKYKDTPLSVQDNLQTDTNTSEGLLAIPCRMIKDGVTSPNNYAVDGVHYEFDVENNFSKLYLYFEWQSISALADGIFTTTKLFNGKYRNYYSVGAMGVTQCGNVYRNTQYGNAKEGTDTLNNFVIPSGLDGYDFADAYFSFAGKDAIWIRYTGENRTAVSMKVKSDGIVVTVGEDSRTFNFASSDLLSTVIDTISAETDLEAGWYKCGNHTFGELLKNDNLDISLLQEIEGDGNIQDIITNPRVYLPLALDKEWHTCEILVDIPGREVHVNHDGFSTGSTLDSDVLNVLALDKSTICIGDAISGGNCPIRLRNLDLQIDNDGGAEVIQYSHCVPQPNGTTWRKFIRRMISPRNPNIVIYEGHGVIVGKDSDVDSSTISFVSENGMACTTDRLMNILAKAKETGYEFVSFKDILEWKLYGKRLPKRCMAMMFDDFRIDVYLDYDKKYPFTKYGITPGLAIITNPSRDLDEEVTYNGLTCTYREAMRIIKDAGWYLASHSYNHRNHVNMEYSDRLAALKLDDIYAKPYRVQMEIYAYGGNNYDYREDSSMKAVPVSIGIGGEVPDYICKGSNQYNLTRYDCGLRISYADSIAHLV